MCHFYSKVMILWHFFNDPFHNFLDIAPRLVLVDKVWLIHYLP